MQHWLKSILVLLLATSVTAAAPRADEVPPVERVVILANRSDADSLLIARHYAEMRGVPPANIIALPMPVAETVTWSEFVPTIWAPLMDRLVRDHWIDAIPMDLTDAVGRRKFAVNSHRVAALVVCRGVPLRIAHDPSLYAEVPPLTQHVEFRTNAAAVDAELALLPAPNHPINAFVLNPLYQNEHPTTQDLQQVFKVSRLDGPTVEQANALVDRALMAEKAGLLGRAYVDLSDRDEIGNGWLEDTAAQLKQLGFETDVDRAPALMPRDARCDAPVLYFGWYTENLDGPFALPGFRFPPGAIALHIHSYSATTMRSETIGWTGPLVARGVTATVGNVYEPYLQLTHRPNLMLRALARGATLVDAAYFSLQGLSWQAVLVGDPLYRPFAVSLSQQLAREEVSANELTVYARLRRVNQLERAGRGDEAISILRAAAQRGNSLPVAMALAQRLMAAGKPGEAARSLDHVTTNSLATDQWGLVRAAAQLLSKCGRFEAAVAMWRTLLAGSQPPTLLRQSWLREAATAAAAAHDTVQAQAWNAEAEALTPAPAPS